MNLYGMDLDVWAHQSRREFGEWLARRNVPDKDSLGARYAWEDRAFEDWFTQNRAFLEKQFAQAFSDGMVAADEPTEHKR